MERRAFLAGTAGLASPVLAGCAVGGGLAGSANPSGDQAGRTPPPTPITGADGKPADICERTPKPGLIPAVVDPSFGSDWPGELPASELVVGVERAGTAKAYPLSVLIRSEVVNDAFDLPVIVTYCVLCGTAIVAVRRVNGEPTVFENTGLTWRAPEAAGQAAIDGDEVIGVSVPGLPGSSGPTNDRNLVLFDRATGSFWSQLLTRAICGPATGETLTLLPARFTQWGTWREEHPDTEVLLPPPLETSDGG